MPPFYEAQFKSKVEAALAAVKRCLDDNRRPCYPSDVAHRYEDKYLLAELTTNTAIAAYINALGTVGLDSAKLSTARAWASEGKTVTIRFEATERCEFSREEERKEESAELVTKSTWRGESKTSVVTKIREYYYKVIVKHTLLIYTGADPRNAACRLVLAERTGETELLCTTKNAPRPDVKVHSPIEAAVTWLLKQQAEDGTMQFKINRDDEKCKTPRRNKDVDEALSCFSVNRQFSNRLVAFMHSGIFSLPRLPGRPKLDASAATRTDAVFNPVLPLLEEEHAAVAGAAVSDDALARMPPSGSVLLLQASDVNALLAEQQRSMKEHGAALAKVFPAPASEDVATHAEAILAATFVHGSEVAERFVECLDCVESMLRSQLYEAIGKEVTPADFDAYMAYHQRKVFAPAFAPKPFCHAIRRPEHYPEGTVAIEGTDDAHEPILTQARTIPEDLASPVCIRLNASTQVELCGPQYLHGYVANSFASVGGRDLQLSARARQFSSFMLVVGKMVPGAGLDPEHAIIVQNKDDLKIPLLLEKLPTPKAFRDAIESLSPEMQRFAKAYRAMQLSGTVFGIAVIQLKPQMERLLQLPADALTKEINLTQRLLGLFIEHQIPSDLLRFDGDASASPREKLDAVRTSVEAIETMMAAEREAELKLREQEAKFEHPMQTPPGMPMPQAASMMTGGAYGGIESSMDMELADSCDTFMSVAPVKQKKMSRAPRSMAMRSRSAKPAMAMAMAPPMAPKQSAMPRPAPAPMPDVGGGGGSGSGASQVTVAPSKSTPAASAISVEGFNFCSIPGVLDERFEAFDPDAALASTTIKLKPEWSRTQQRKLLAKSVSGTLGEKQQKDEKNRAFDLLDALSRSGTLPIECSELHVLIAATHCFDKSVMETVVIDNINPIEKVERSALILGSTIHGVEAPQLVKPCETERIAQYSAPVLMSAAALE